MLVRQLLTSIVPKRLPYCLITIVVLFFPPGTSLAQQPFGPLPTTNSASPTQNVLTLDEAVRLSTLQASSFQQAAINERIAAEDLRQAKSAFLPQITVPLSYLYTTPALGLPPGEPRVQSFIANNAIGEYQGYLALSGDLDIAGKLRATVAKNRALLAAAQAGTDVARRTLTEAVIEAYYGLALATAQRRAAEQNLTTAEEFENITSLLLSGGEVAAVDLTRAQLQTTARRDELEKARATEDVAAGGLRVFVGYEFSRSIATSDIALAAPVDSELQRFNSADVLRRPEFLQFDAELKAAKQDARIAHADRLPSLTYTVLGGFDTDSLHSPRFKEHSGASGLLSLNIPVFDWGATKSRERQAQLRVELAQNQRALAIREFNQQFYAAQAQATRAATRVRLAQTAISQAETNVSASVARYRAGEAQIVEVTDAQTTLVTERAAFYQALFDYQIALSRLRQATGR
jgi:outer membrane protein TolC